METRQSRMDEPFRDSYGLPRTECKILEPDPQETLEFRALREAHNSRMAQLNNTNQSLRSATNSYAVAHRCLKQLAGKLSISDESLNAILLSMKSTPDDTIGSSQAWRVNIEVIDDTQRYWQKELDWVSQRLKDVHAQVRPAIEKTAGVVSGHLREKSKRQASVPPPWALMYDGSDSDYDELRCSGWHQLTSEDISTGVSIKTEMEHSKTYPSQYLTLYSLWRPFINLRVQLWATSD